MQGRNANNQEGRGTRSTRHFLTYDEIDFPSKASRFSVAVSGLDPGHHGGHQVLQQLGSLLPCLEDLLVVGLLLALVVHDSKVGDQGQGEDAHAAVARYDHLVDRAHAWGGEDSLFGTSREERLFLGPGAAPPVRNTTLARKYSPTASAPSM